MKKPGCLSGLFSSLVRTGDTRDKCRCGEELRLSVWDWQSGRKRRFMKRIAVWNTAFWGCGADAAVDQTLVDAFPVRRLILRAPGAWPLFEAHRPSMPSMV